MLRSNRVCWTLLLAGALGATTAFAATPDAQAPPQEHPVLREIAAAPNPAEMRATIAKLVSFGTRHTLSDTKSDKRGIGAARRWAAARFAAISHDCGACLTLVTPAQTFTGKRIPQPAEVMDVVAIQKGTTDPNRVIIFTGHIDSRVTDVMNATADAPGANDDGSGVAAVIEAARVLSKYHFPATLVYGVVAGEEQGLYGGQVLAQYAQAQGWQVEAELNNDIVGGISGVNGVIDNTRVRLFSEGTRETETAAEQKQRRLEGGELDAPSRNLARYIKQVAEALIPNWKVDLIYRVDRYGRGGDHEPFNALSMPAVRFTQGTEDYTHQHQDLRTENGVRYGDTLDGVDFGYLAKVAASNMVAAASLAWAPAPPDALQAVGAVSPDTQLSWQPAVNDANQTAGYRVYWRETTDAVWTHSRYVGKTVSATLENLVIDDYFFGVASVSADGFESPVEFPGPIGAFARGLPLAAAEKGG
ncbi:MAG: peptidase [Nevskia sp.]|nr:peptidase [Nevskia sp.]